MKMKKILIILLMSMFLIGTAFAAGSVKTSEEQAQEKIMEGKFIKDQSHKSQQEKQMFTNEIAGSIDNVYAEYPSDELTIYENKNKIHIRSTIHFQRSIRIPWNEITQIDGFKGDSNSGRVLVTHIPDIGVPQSWVYNCFNDGGYAYFDDLPFSEVIIGGAFGTYVKNGTVTYSTSPVFSLGSTFEASNIDYINATVTPVYEETSPYDIPTNGLVASYFFDENDGTTLIDSSGNGNNGTITNMTWTDGKYNYAGSFNSSLSACSAVPYSEQFNLSTYDNMSVVVFFTPSQQPSDFSRIIDRFSGGTPGSGYMISLRSDNVIQADGRCVSNNVYLRSSPISLNDRHYLCFVTSGTISKLYVDLVSSTDVYDGYILNNVYATNIGSYRGTSNFYNGSIDYVLIYNRALNETEIKQIYYDNLQQLKLKTNGNSTYSNYVNGSCTVSIPYGSGDSDITSLATNVPDNVTIGGVIVRDYGNTTTPFNISTEIGYTENTTLVDEKLTDEYYQLSIRFVPGNDYTGGIVSYTSDSNSILSSSYMTYNFTSTNENATLDYDSVTREWSITTGPLTQNESDVYNIMAYLNYTTVLDVYEGFGDEHVETYPITGNETNAIGSRYVVSSDSIFSDLNNGSDIWIPAAGLIAVCVIMLFAGFAIKKLGGYE